MKKDEVKKQWHGPICAAMWLELRANKESLEFHKEYNLTSGPLRIDLIIVLKPDEKEVENKIGKFFKRHNILEYKSPNDSLNVETFFKVIAYACFLRALPQSIGIIEEDQITISLVREGYPRELMKYLARKQFKITKEWEGIYYVRKEGFFPIQVIVTRKLDEKEHIWLTALTRKMSRKQADLLADEAGKLEELDEILYSKVVLDLSMNVNANVFNKMKEEDPMRYLGFEKVFKKELAEAKLEGKVEGKAEGITGTKMQDIEGILKMFHATLEEACQAVGITVSDYYKMKELVGAKTA